MQDITEFFSDIILMYFDTHTKSPITLLELGLFAGQAKEKKKNMIVCCGEGFRRKGNVDVVCKRYDIPQVDTLEEAIDAIKAILAAK